MTQQQIIDYIHLTLSPIDKTNRFHKEFIKIACDLVYSQLMARVNDAMIGDLDLFSKEYTSQVLTLDVVKNLYYYTLPTAIVPIPGITSGIRHINTNQGLDLDFIPTTELEMYYADGSVTQTTDTTIGYWLQGDKIWFDESMTKAIADTGIRILLLPRFAGFARTDTINIPGCTDIEFITQVLQLLAPTAPVDLKANNA